MGNIAWIELVFFYGIAMGFGLWQWLKMRRELRESREKRAAEEAEKALKSETTAKPD